MKVHVFSKPLVYLITLALLLNIFYINPIKSYAVNTNTTYYLDSANGNDSNNGTSESTAWATLSNINSVTLEPGDKVYFKSGSTFTGQFAPSGSGADGNPIVIDSYGTGNDPVIDGAGTVTEAVYLYNNTYIELNNLEVTNLGTTELSGRIGIKVFIEDIGIANHIYLNNLYVHDVNSDSVNKNAGGIIFDALGDYIPEGETGGLLITKYNDVRITNCTIRDVNRTGINCGGSSAWETIENGLSYDLDDDLETP